MLVIEKPNKYPMQSQLGFIRPTAVDFPLSNKALNMTRRAKFYRWLVGNTLNLLLDSIQRNTFFPPCFIPVDCSRRILFLSPTAVFFHL